MSIWKTLFFMFRGLFVGRSNLISENLALRQQLIVQQRTVKRPKLTKKDRIFWVWLSQIWPEWKSAMIIVKPETVIKWHRQGFRLYWQWKSRRKPGGPKVSKEIRDLIGQMSQENPTWGAPRIQSELSLLGFGVADSTVATYMVRHRKPPSRAWRTFLKNHVKQIAATDFFTVPTVRFQILYCFIILRHHRRKVVHFGVTRNPTTSWTTQQITEAFPYESAPKYMIRDRDRIYGKAFTQRVRVMGIKEVLIAPRSPWQNPFVERVIGSVRREYLDNFIILNGRHLHQVLTSYFDYYNHSRTHLVLERNSPVPRKVEHESKGNVISIPQVGGLHHVYKRVA
jgi:transposase InsO family protein